MHGAHILHSCANGGPAGSRSFCSPEGTSDLFDRIVRELLPINQRCAIAHLQGHQEDRYRAWHRCIKLGKAARSQAQRARVASAARTLGKGSLANMELSAVVADVQMMQRGIGMGILSHGVYIEQLRHWLRITPREQMLLLLSDDLFSDTAATVTPSRTTRLQSTQSHPLVGQMGLVERHLGLDAFPWEDVVKQK